LLHSDVAPAHQHPHTTRTLTPAANEPRCSSIHTRSLFPWSHLRAAPTTAFPSYNHHSIADSNSKGFAKSAVAWLAPISAVPVYHVKQPPTTCPLWRSQIYLAFRAQAIHKGRDFCCLVFVFVVVLEWTVNKCCTQTCPVGRLVHTRAIVAPS
jgi:hypothetical protein